jgi:hypothetical protein
MVTEIGGHEERNSRGVLDEMKLLHRLLFGHGMRGGVPVHVVKLVFVYLQ